MAVLRYDTPVQWRSSGVPEHQLRATDPRTFPEPVRRHRHKYGKAQVLNLESGPQSISIAIDRRPQGKALDKTNVRSNPGD